MSQQNPYHLLGVEPHASREEIRSAFLKRAKVLHPDRFDQASQQVEWQMANDMLKELNEAYASLSKTPQQRSISELSDEDKELILECFEVIRQEKRASTSNLQRRLRLGYNRAAYVIDYLEKIGVIAPGEGAKPREINVDLETYELNL